MPQKQRIIAPRPGTIVGTVHTARGLAEAARAGAGLVVEIRADALPRPPAPRDLARISPPILLTVRCPEEGGQRDLDDARRAEIYLSLLAVVAGIDVELRSARRLQAVLHAARAARKTIVLSFHDFEATPSLATLRGIVRRARSHGADIAKIATRADSPDDVARLLRLLGETPDPLSVMGMGTLGRASRLLFARAGSVLNYGYFDRPNAPGQWSAGELKALVARG